MVVNMTIEEMIGLVIMVVLFGTMLITYTFKFIEDSCRREREKAIDEFAKSLNERLEEEKKYCSYHPHTRDETINKSIEIVNQLAEQLKAGGKDE